jgi:hypothetical protein
MQSGMSEEWCSLLIDSFLFVRLCGFVLAQLGAEEEEEAVVQKDLVVCSFHIRAQDL